MMLIVITEL